LDQESDQEEIPTAQAKYGQPKLFPGER